MRAKKNDEYAARILLQMPCQAMGKQKHLKHVKCYLKVETGPSEGNWDQENLLKNQRGTIG